MAEIEVIWSRRAVDDFEELVSYISQDSELYAVNFATKIVNAVETLKVFPEIGRIVPEYNSPGIREIIYRNYRIIYKLIPGSVEIVTVFQGSRHLE